MMDWVLVLIMAAFLILGYFVLDCFIRFMNEVCRRRRSN